MRDSSSPASRAALMSPPKTPLLASGSRRKVKKGRFTFMDEGPSKVESPSKVADLFRKGSSSAAVAESPLLTKGPFRRAVEGEKKKVVAAFAAAESTSIKLVTTDEYSAAPR